jgi:succinate dehydrogenase / fumarate reductase cytochrome b subunit
MWNWLSKTFNSSIGKKAVVALSGLGLVLFLVVHLAGNLTLFADDDGAAFDGYAHALEANPLLPVAEIGLLVLLLVHVVMAVRVSRENHEARAQRNAARASFGASTPGSRSMIVTGALVLLFIVIHISDFRARTLFAPWEGGTLAGMVKERLASPAGMVIYALGSIVVGVHLSHGIRSVFQSLGFSHPRWNVLLRNGGLALAVLLGLGFLSFPIVLFFFN